MSNRTNSKLLTFAMFTFLAFAVSELLAGILGSSLSLIVDAVTMIVDAISYGLNGFVERNKDPRASREDRLLSEVLVPFTSVLVLIGISVYGMYDALNTLASPSGENADLVTMFTFAGLNLLIDVANIYTFARHGTMDGHIVLTENESADDGNAEHGGISESHDEARQDLVSGEEVEKQPNLNMWSAATHIGADTLRSISVFVAATVSQLDSRVGSEVADAWAAIIVSITIFLSVIPLLKGLYARATDTCAIKQVTDTGYESLDP